MMGVHGLFGHQEPDIAVCDYLEAGAKRRQETQEKPAQDLTTAYIVGRHEGESYVAWLARLGIERDDARFSQAE